MKRHFDPTLIEILICPNCKGTVSYDEHGQTIDCQGTCKLRYPVIDGIPHLLIQEGVKPDE